MMDTVTVFHAAAMAEVRGNDYDKKAQSGGTCGLLLNLESSVGGCVKARDAIDRARGPRVQQ